MKPCPFCGNSKLRFLSLRKTLTSGLIFETGARILCDHCKANVNISTGMIAQVEGESVKDHNLKAIEKELKLREKVKKQWNKRK